MAARADFKMMRKHMRTINHNSGKRALRGVKGQKRQRLLSVV
jgi:hypothetical protein